MFHAYPNVFTSRFTFHVSRFTFHVSRFTFHVPSASNRNLTRISARGPSGNRNYLPVRGAGSPACRRAGRAPKLYRPNTPGRGRGRDRDRGPDSAPRLWPLGSISTKAIQE